MSEVIQVNGITVSYEQRGRGPDVVLLHGGLSSGAVWERLPATAIAQIGAAALVVAGDRDEFVGLDLSVSLYRMLTDADLAVCPSASHESPMGQDRADIFATLIGDFCRRSLRGGAK